MDINHSLELAPSILDSAMGLIHILIAKKFAGMFITSMAIAGLTFGLLELFMSPGLKFAYGHKKMPEKAATRFMIAIILLIVTFAPLAAAIAQLVHPFRGLTFIKAIQNFMIAAGISIVLCWILSFILKRYLDPTERRHKNFLILEAFSVIIQTMGAYLADWLTRIIMSIINLSIRIVHRPFVLEYGIVAVVLNLLFSFLILGIMGQSNDAGAANIAGSLIGGLMHAIIRRKKVKEIRKAYMERIKPKHNDRKSRKTTEEEADEYI